MPAPTAFQPPPTAIPEPPVFPSLMETQAPDAYLHAGFWDTWGIWLALAAILLAVAAAVILLIRKKGRTAPAPLTPAQSARQGHHHAPGNTPVPQAGRRGLLPYPAKIPGGGNQRPGPVRDPAGIQPPADALTALSTELQGPTRDLLDRMAVLKYEPDTPENDSMVNELADRTVQLINDIDAASRTTQEETDLIVKKPSARTNQR